MEEFDMKTKNRILSFFIEAEGYLGLICFFSAVWMDSIRWKLFSTGIILWLLAIMNYAVLNRRQK